MSSHRNQQQPRSNKNRASQNQPHPINLSYTNVRGLRTNFSSIHPTYWPYVKQILTIQYQTENLMFQGIRPLSPNMII